MLRTRARDQPIALELPRNGDRALFLRIADALGRAIEAGRFAAESRLPGTRELARALGVHRNTVVAAYAELEAQGYVEARAACGTFVRAAFVAEPLRAAPLGARRPRASANEGARRSTIGTEAGRGTARTAGAVATLAGSSGAVPRSGSGGRRDVPGRRAGSTASNERPDSADPWDEDADEPRAQRDASRILSATRAKDHVLRLDAGVPDLRLFPHLALARAYRRVLRAHGRTLLGYGDPRGELALRVALASALRVRRALDVDEHSLIVVRGSQMGLDLAARTLVRPGDTVAVEALGYRPAWSALRAQGACLVGVPLDDDGLDVDALTSLARRRRIRAVYVTPHHQYPTAVTLAPARRAALLAAATREGFSILEDDYDGELHFAGSPPLPLAAKDAAGRVVYVGSLSKILAPTLRLGVVVARRDLLDAMVAARVGIDRQGDRVLERAVAELFDDGTVTRHLRKLRVATELRRDALAGALERALPGAFDVRLPRGGMSLFARATAPAVHDVDALAKRARGLGVLVAPASVYALDGEPRPSLRLAYAALDEAELRVAVKRLARAVHSSRG